MSIGLNYSYLQVGERKILPNYLYVLPSNFWPGEEFSRPDLDKLIENGVVMERLTSDETTHRFDDPRIQDILEEAFPYEVTMKYRGKEVANQDDRNTRLIKLFNRFFLFDYEEALTAYCDDTETDIVFKRAQAIRNELHYDDRPATVEEFLSFVEKLLTSQGYKDEAGALRRYANTKLQISYTPGISGTTSEVGEATRIEVGNTTYTTLYHELAHFVNRFFRFHYYENDEVCFDNYTKTNEGFANFVAYHLSEYIGPGEIDALDDVSLEPRFFSAYIDVYAHLKVDGSNKRTKNYDIVYQLMKKFGGELFTDEKADFYYERFYKFFHYDQHEYFYPKEMMYYIGYQRIRALFQSVPDKTQLLTQCFLGKICL